jgi:hypothetical protein
MKSPTAWDVLQNSTRFAGGIIVESVGASTASNAPRIEDCVHGWSVLGDKGWPHDHGGMLFTAYHGSAAPTDPWRGHHHPE